MVLAMLRSMVYDKNAVDDLFQETMITAWRTLDRYDEERPFGPCGSEASPGSRPSPTTGR